MLEVQRGFNTYKKLLFDEDQAAPVVTDQRGRDPLLIEKRDEFLLHRIYYKSTIEQKIYATILKELRDEVFLSKTMLQKIISTKTDELLAIKRQKPSIKLLREKWPHIVWAA